MEQTVEESEDSEFLPFLEAIGINWDPTSQLMLRRLNIHTERDFMRSMFNTPIGTYNILNQLDYGVDEHRKQQIILDLVTRIMFLRYYIRTSLDLPTDDIQQMMQYSYAMLRDNAFLPDWFRMSYQAQQPWFR